MLKLSTRIGQKFSLLLCALPQIAGWLLIYYARSPFYLIMSRVMSGLGGGGLYSIVPTYISEIADDNVRGTLGSTLVFSCNLGLCFAYVCGEYVEYLTIPWVMLPASIAFVVLFLNVPDSPTFFAKKSLYDVSFPSIKTLRADEKTFPPPPARRKISALLQKSQEALEECTSASRGRARAPSSQLQGRRRFDFR